MNSENRKVSHPYRLLRNLKKFRFVALSNLRN